MTKQVTQGRHLELRRDAWVFAIRLIQSCGGESFEDRVDLTEREIQGVILPELKAIARALRRTAPRPSVSK